MGLAEEVTGLADTTDQSQVREDLAGVEAIGAAQPLVNVLAQIAQGG